MSIFSNLSRLSLGQLVRNACVALAHLDDAPKYAARFLNDRFTDHSTKLADALKKANERAWKVIELALEEETVWSKMALSGDELKFARAIRGFLADKNSFRAAALDELRRARNQGLLAADPLDPAKLASETTCLARFTNPIEVLNAERQVLVEIGGVLKSNGCDQLAWLLNQRPGEEPLGVAVAVYFFRTEIEKDTQLFQGLAFDLLMQLIKEVRSIEKRMATPPGRHSLTGRFWDGNTRGKHLSAEELQQRTTLADAAKKANWKVVLDIVTKSPDFVNSCRPGRGEILRPAPPGRSQRGAAGGRPELYPHGGLANAA